MRSRKRRMRWEQEEEERDEEEEGKKEDEKNEEDKEDKKKDEEKKQEPQSALTEPELTKPELTDPEDAPSEPVIRPRKKKTANKLATRFNVIFDGVNSIAFVFCESSRLVKGIAKHVQAIKRCK